MMPPTQEQMNEWPDPLLIEQLTLSVGDWDRYYIIHTEVLKRMDHSANWKSLRDAVVGD